MTVGQLKYLLKDIDDDMIVLRASGLGSERVVDVSIQEVRDNFDKDSDGNSKKITAAIID